MNTSTQPASEPAEVSTVERSDAVRVADQIGLNAGQRKFCQLVAEGWSQVGAYVVAYPNSSRPSARANAARLIAKDSVQQYLGHLRDRAEAATTLSIREKRQVLAHIVRTHVSDFFDEEGGLSIAGPNAVAVKRVNLRHSTDSAGRVTRDISLELVDKLAALRLDQMLGEGDRVKPLKWEDPETQADLRAQAAKRLKESMSQSPALRRHVADSGGVDAVLRRSESREQLVKALKFLG